MISVTVLTKNSQKYLTELLDALIAFDEVLLFDNGSTDETLEMARKYPNVTIHTGSFE
ncbi:MAG: glycosyltransferase, partial [Parachlamydiaceae bacterium]